MSQQTKQTKRELFSNQGKIRYLEYDPLINDGVIRSPERYVGLINFITYARSQNEAQNLNFVMSGIFEHGAHIQPHDPNYFGLEARLDLGTAEFASNEPKNSLYEITVRPIKGAIKKVDFDRSKMQVTTSTPNFVNFVWQGFGGMYNGLHSVNLYYNPPT